MTAAEKKPPKRDPAGNEFLRRANAAIGETIAAARKERGLSRAEVVTRLHRYGATHMHESTLNAIERGVQALRAGEVAPLAAILEMYPDDLLTAHLRPEAMMEVLSAVENFESFTIATVSQIRHYDAYRAELVAVMDADTQGETLAADPELWDMALAIREGDRGSWLGTVLSMIDEEERGRP